MDHARDVLDFWFGELPYDAATFESRMRFWFGYGDAAERRRTDEHVRARLLPLLNTAARGGLDAWASSPRRRLALILLFDQVPRNVFRATAAAFAFDAKALRLTTEGVTLAADVLLDPVERIFFYMPLQHAESPELQEEAVLAFRRLAADAPLELRAGLHNCLQEAQTHAEIVQRFGRFPHRNRVLQRENTPDEATWLASRAQRFGQ